MLWRATLVAAALQLSLTYGAFAQVTYIYTAGQFPLPAVTLPPVTVNTNFTYPPPPVQYTGQPPNGCVWEGASYSDGATILREVKASYVWKCSRGSWTPYGTVGEAFNHRPARMIAPKDANPPR